ncbi:MAG: hypothetical protein QNK37_03435 [Acidobacteriota bacterium]|nr:hypothetical protein [Acidobacteriota bacterium]
MNHYFCQFCRRTIHEVGLMSLDVKARPRTYQCTYCYWGDPHPSSPTQLSLPLDG